MKLTYIPKTDKYLFKGKQYKNCPIELKTNSPRNQPILELTNISYKVKLMAPTRILIEPDYGVPPNRTDIKPDIIFVRDDNWSLGAPKKLEANAYNLWADSWTHFAQAPHFVKQPICEYLAN